MQVIVANFLGLGGPELIVILVILLLLFGAKKLPELAKSLGQSAKELRKGINGGGDEDDKTKEGSKNA